MIFVDRALRFFGLHRTSERDVDSADRVVRPFRSLAGVAVNEDTALTVPVVWACLRYLSQTPAMLPWHVHRELRTGGNVIASSHPVDWLLYARPNSEWSSMQFRETLIHWAVRWGNGYAEIERDLAGRPLALWPIHPERVEVCRDPETRQLYYEVDNGSDGRIEIPQEDMFHLRGFGEGPVGVSVITYAAQSIGWAKAAQLFGAAFFGNGMNVQGVVKVKNPLKDKAAKDRIRAEFDSMYRGPRNANKTAILDADMDWQQVSVDPDKAQFITTNQHLVEEGCRWFGVPPHKVAHLLRATNNNIEHQGIEAVQDCVQPWTKRLEDEADYKLFGQNRRGHYTKINLLGLQRGDFKSQAEGFRIYREMGVVNADEIRERLDMNPQPDGAGQKYTMNGAYTTLERIGEEPTAPQSAAPAGQSVSALDEDPEAIAMLPALVNALERADA